MLNDVTVIIKTFLHDSQVVRCIETLKATYPDIKVFVADDGRVNKAEQMKELGVDRYMFYEPFNSLGLTGGRNKLLELVETPYFLICDDDSVWTKDARLEDLKKLMDVADVACGTVRTLGVIGHYEGNWSRSVDNGLIYNALDMNIDCHLYDDIRHFHLDLADEFFIAKKEVFDKVKWDEDFHVLYQHSDYFLSLKKERISVVYAPDCIIDHKSVDLPQTDEYSNFRCNDADLNKYRDMFLKKWGYDYLVLFNGSKENST